MRPVRLAALTLAALTLAACGEKEAVPGATPEPQKLTVMLDFFPNADHAGIYAAEAAGEFERANLEVDIQPPPDPATPLRLLQAGRIDLAISYQPELLLARDKGADLVSVAALVQKPLTSLMWLEDGDVRSVADLEGKKVGTAGIPYQSAYLRSILEQENVDPDSVEEINVGFELGRAMVSGRVDATLGAFWNYEGVDLERRGRQPQISRVEELGVPTYNELVVVARKSDLDTQGAARLRRFLLALTRGHRIVREDPERAVDALMKANPDLDRGLQRAVVRATTPVFFPEDDQLPWGFQDENAWIAYGNWMFREDLLEQDPRAGSAVTNEFLPGQGLETDRTQF
jgi:putative hydroxymethylpyrimidine transport system substrate-binding protein